MPVSPPRTAPSRWPKGCGSRRLPTPAPHNRNDHDPDPGGTPMITTIGEIVRGDASVFPPYLYEAYRSTIKRAPQQPLVDLPLTLSERTGPGPALHELVKEDADLTRNSVQGGEAIGQRIVVTGRVLDPFGR